MKKFVTFTLLLSLCQFIFAQDEELTDLSFNPALYHSTKAYQPASHTHKYLVDKSNIIVTTDTLQLPFVDDFSTNRLRSYKWIENNITDTFRNVFGTCLGNEGVSTIPGRFMQDTSWSYSFDTLTQRIDSTAKAPIAFTFFGPATSVCFTQTPQNFTYWPEYYTYTFDSTAGKPRDSVLVTGSPSDSIYYAPFIYFSKAESGTLWFDNYAYHNYTYPVNPPTIGVATLDGLNEYGLPYNNANTNTYGTADYLTSLPINLASVTEGDSLYLSFFYEAQGLGDSPDKNDSLIVEFKDNSGAWRTVWSDTGYSSSLYVPQTFKQVLINVPQLAIPYTYFYSTFQFRFRNKASLYGNNDHWHIDYVRFDKTRFATDTNIQDIAFVYPFPTILKNFTLMPADQFSNPADLRDSITLTVRNLERDANNNPPATNFTKGAEQVYPTPVVIIAPDVLQTFNAGDYNYLQVSPSAEYTIPVATVDSLILSSTVLINPNDSRPQNDTLHHTQNFNSVMAYDDGTAERAYGISGLGLKKFAYEFNLNQPDTLVAFQVQYSQVDVNISNLVFNFNGWSSVTLNDMSFDDASTRIFSLDNRRPFYIDSMNGFTTYKLDTPLILSGKVYLGWTQTDTRRMQIGYDLNSTLGKQHMFVFTGTTWKASTITPDGSPMIRLIFDSNYWGGTSSVTDLTKDENRITFFPNPTSGLLQIRSEREGVLLDVTVTDMLGQRVKHENGIINQVDIRDLQNGIYLLSAKDNSTGETHHSKVIKAAY
ncbi:MAG: T9SS type A sorting domain-containing protein [Bacteroidota bacterium]